MTDRSLDQNHYLEVYFIDELGCVEVIGNNSGLEYLERICFTLLKKNTPGKYNLNYDSKALTGAPKQQKFYTTDSGEKLTQRLVAEVIINFDPSLKGWVFGGKTQEKSADGINWISKIKDVDKSIDTNYYLKAIYNEQEGILNITGNKAGFGFFTEIISRFTTYEHNEHWHFSSAFNSLTKDSLEEFVLIIDPEVKKLALK